MPLEELYSLVFALLLRLLLLKYFWYSTNNNNKVHLLVFNSFNHIFFMG